MTSEQRLDRIEHLTAGWIEQSKKEHAENRELWRQTQRQIQESIDATNKTIQEVDRRLGEKLEAFAEEGRSQMATIRAEMAERDVKLDARIGDLVKAMGEFIRRA